MRIFSRHTKVMLPKWHINSLGAVFTSNIKQQYCSCSLRVIMLATMVLSVVESKALIKIMEIVGLNEYCRCSIWPFIYLLTHNWKDIFISKSLFFTFKKFRWIYWKLCLFFSNRQITKVTNEIKIGSNFSIKFTFIVQNLTNFNVPN